MSELALPKDSARAQTGLAATLQHARYVLRDNAVTGFAFALFALIVLAALIGPYIVPYDPLASDTVVATRACRAVVARVQLPSRLLAPRSANPSCTREVSANSVMRCGFLQLAGR